MNTTQIQLINFLKAALFEKVAVFDSSDKIIWKAILEEAEAHNVVGLLYAAVNKSEHLKYIEKEHLEQWKRDTFISAIQQIKHIRQISKVLKIFNEGNIPVIVLKGLVIREFYPKPELRTMCDADILVKKEDLYKVKKLLLDLGYTESERTGIHIAFDHDNHFTIEVHWTLSNKYFLKGQSIFENQIWKNTIEVKVENSETLSLSYEDLAVHLCIHMAVHSGNSGFGIRQLYDLALLVKNKGHLIDWSSFLDKIRECEVEKFTIAIFQVCRQLFNMTIPEELNNINFEKEDFLMLLINDIFSAGVHGKRNMSKLLSNKLAYDSNDVDCHNYKGIVKRFIIMLFPPINKLSNRYGYAKKYIILVPVAWGHHFLCGVFNKEISFFSKVKFLISGAYISNRRNKLLRWLELI